MEKEAGGGGLDNRRYPYNLKGVRAENDPTTRRRAHGGGTRLPVQAWRTFFEQPDASSACAPEKGDCCHHNENMPAHRSCFHTPAIRFSALTCAGGRRAAFG